MRRISPSIDNTFFFWGGDPTGKIEQINTALLSWCVHNPQVQVYLFSNDLSAENLGKDIVRRYPVMVVPWTVEDLTRNTPFFHRANEFKTEYLRERGAKMNPHSVFSDFFRYLVLLRWGGTYLDLDDVCIRPAPQHTNVVPASMTTTDPVEARQESLTKERNGAGDRYLRLGNDPLFRFEPEHPFIRRCLETALDWPPDIAGSRVMTEVYASSEQPPAIEVRPEIDVLLHPSSSLASYVSRQCEWAEDKWWWAHVSEDQFQVRWFSLLRLGNFPLVKNHGWRAMEPNNAERMLSEWVQYFSPGNPGASGVIRSNTAVSVVIPTHKQRFLADALDGLTRQSDRDFEVIVVENGVRYPASEGIVNARRSALSIQYAHEKRLGLNIARNTGCRLARGSIIALLDDDCIPDKNWIANLRAHFANYPQTCILAGHVSLRFRSAKPNWLTGEFRALLSELKAGPDSMFSGQPAWVVGANFAFPRRVFDQTGGFDEGMGMVGKSPPQLCHDETEFCRRAKDLSGLGIMFNEDVRVEHQITQERLQIDFFEQRKYGQGISDVSMILDRERRATQEALEKLERHLYDPDWLVRLDRIDDPAGCDNTKLFVVNSIRTRIEYLSGLAAACLENMPPDKQRREKISRYQIRARVTARYWQRDTPDMNDNLVRLARVMAGTADKKHFQRQRCVSPTTMFGRAAFFQALKHELVTAN